MQKLQIVLNHLSSHGEKLKTSNAHFSSERFAILDMLFLQMGTGYKMGTNGASAILSNKII